MSDKIIIRDGTYDDAELIASFNTAMALETENKQLDAALAKGGSEAGLLDPLNGFYLIAMKEDEAVGSLLVTFEWSDWSNAMHWWIQSVYVLPAHRGTGVYRQLYEEVKNRARLRGNVADLRLYVEKDNATAQATYRKLGMTETPYRIFEASLDPK